MPPLAIAGTVPSRGSSRTLKVIVALFVIACLGIFFGFIARHPLDWQQPETLRLHYYALQSGLRGGPLSPTLEMNDLFKPLVWKAQGGMFDGRYPIMLLDGLLPKLYHALYPLTGPFLSEPFNLLLIVLTLGLTVMLVHEWFGSWPAAFVTGAGWLVTSQTLLDARYPIRPNMALLTLLIAYVLWELVRLRNREGGVAPYFRLGLGLVACLFCHEYGLIFVPLLLLIAGLEGRRGQRGFFFLAITCGMAYAIYFTALFLLLPPLALRVTGESPTMDWMMGGFKPLLQNPSSLLSRFRHFALVGLQEIVRQNLGYGIFLNRAEKLLGPAAFLVFLVLTRKAGWRKAIPLFGAASLFFLAVAMLMFPIIPSAVEMPAYYYAPIVIIFTFAWGALLSGWRHRGDEWRWGIGCAAFICIGWLNMKQSAAVMERMPGDFGFNQSARNYVRDILSLGGGLSRKEGIVPTYTAYPRPRWFDISTRWDIMLRVWKGESEMVFSLMLPVLHLDLFEKQFLLSSSDEFVTTAELNPPNYESRAGIYWDMPRRKLYNFYQLRNLELSGDRRRETVWTSPDGEARILALWSATLLGHQPRAKLGPGFWEVKVPPPDTFPSPLVMLVMVRADIMPSVPDDVMNRKRPLPLRRCTFSLREEKSDVTIYSEPQRYGWSYQLFQVELKEKPPGGWKVSLEGEGEMEVIGPAVVPTAALRFPSGSKPYRGVLRF